MSLEVNITKKLGSYTLSSEFELEAGVLAILGPSGSGKSMTLKCIAGIERPDEGRIVLDGRVLFDSGSRVDLPPQKRKVGYMFQDYALFTSMSVRENILAGMKGRDAAERVSEYIKRFRLEGLEDMRPDRLSGGERQRTAMARMLAAEPELIMMDEPFAAMDSALKLELISETEAVIRETGKKVLFVSHDMLEVFRLCDSYAAMTEGELGTVRPVSELESEIRETFSGMLGKGNSSSSG